MLNAVLKVVGGKQDGKLIPLSTRKFLIGREQDCHLRPSSDSVSRHHCAITIDDFTVRVRDLGSSNGTMLNSKRILGVQEANPGDILQIGNLEFEVVFSKAGAPVAAGEGKGGTSFALDEFSLEEAEPLSDTAMMGSGSDTAIIEKKDVESPAEAAAETIEGEFVAPESAETSAAPAPEPTDAQETPASEPPVSEAAPSAAEQTSAPAAPEQLPVEQPAPVADVPNQQPAQPAQIDPAAAAAQQQAAAAQQMPPGYQYPQQAMPGYPQQMPQPGYPYGMPQPGMPQPAMPGYGMPGYGVQQPMPGYGVQPAMPGYGMPQPGMPAPGYPQQQMPYPVAPQPAPVEDYDDDYEDDEEGESEEATSKIAEPPVALPDPAQTGAQEEKPSDEGDDAPKVEAPNPAADILKKYMSGR